MATDPFTGSPIPPDTPTVKCPRGHVHLPDSWKAAGNRCCYPGCDYIGDPVRPTASWVWVAGGLTVLILVVWLAFALGSRKEAFVTPTPAPVTPFVLVSSPTPTSTPEFTIQAYDSQRNTDAECVICLISDWEGPKQPGEYQWQVTFPADKPALLSIGWCSIDEQTLDANWPNMQYELIIDGYRVDLAQLAQTEQVREDRVCYLYSGVLTGWSLGRHSYVWIHHIYSRLNDGWDTYEPGEYVMDFVVDVHSPISSWTTPVHPSATPATTIRQPTPVPRTPTTYQVKAGDTLWDIAKYFYGDGEKWRLIAEVNNIDDPRNLRPGTILTIP